MVNNCASSATRLLAADLLAQDLLLSQGLSSGAQDRKDIFADEDDPGGGDTTINRLDRMACSHRVREVAVPGTCKGENA